MENKLVEVELAIPLAIGGVQYEEGDVVEVYSIQAREMAINRQITEDVYAFDDNIVRPEPVEVNDHPDFENAHADEEVDEDEE